MFIFFEVFGIDVIKIERREMIAFFCPSAVGKWRGRQRGFKLQRCGVEVFNNMGCLRPLRSLGMSFAAEYHENAFDTFLLSSITEPSFDGNSSLSDGSDASPVLLAPYKPFMVSPPIMA